MAKSPKDCSKCICHCHCLCICLCPCLFVGQVMLPHQKQKQITKTNHQLTTATTNVQRCATVPRDAQVRSDIKCNQCEQRNRRSALCTVYCVRCNMMQYY